MIHLPLSGVDVNIWSLLLIGFAVGVFGGFFGIGGAVILTPALNIFGFPMPYAIGTGISYVIGSSTISAIKHWRLGNIDYKLALPLVVSTVPGVELGKRLVMFLENTGQVGPVIRGTYFVLLVSVALYMLWEYYRASSNHKEGDGVGDITDTLLAAKLRRVRLSPMVNLPNSSIAPISLWLLLLVGLVVGFLAGFLGVGGGFIMVPILLYVICCPTKLAVGTSLFCVIFLSAYGGFSYATVARVELVAAVAMLLGAAFGAQLGVIATRYVQGTKLRLFFAITILLAGISVALKQMALSFDSQLLASSANWLVLGMAAGMSFLIILSFIRGIIVKRQYEKGYG